MSLINETLNWLNSQVPNEPEYLQAVSEVLPHIVPIVNANEAYKSNNVLQRILLPQHVHQFAVQWENDNHECEIHTGWRVQHSNVLGPFKGGTRFHETVSLSTLKFLAFEQSFKNSLTGLQIGAGKGGANFSPKERSQSEIRRFSKAYISALRRQIGATVDVPAGDINVSDREIGYMFAELLKQDNKHEGMLSGKPITLGGSELRLQATGYGVMYFVQRMLNQINEDIAHKTICISGAGNVALHTAEKATAMKAIVKTLSNSRGTLFVESGITQPHINWLKQNSDAHSNALEALTSELDGEYFDKHKPWHYQCDIAIPCATQNEINKQDANHLLGNTALAVVEGANMPCDSEAQKVINNSDLYFVPGKAANAGGVVVSAFEMQQHTSMRYETQSALDKRLQNIMHHIHDDCLEESKALTNDRVDYVKGANVRGFRKLADAIVASGF